MAGKRGKSGRRKGSGAKTLAEHVRDGTFRFSDHQHLLDDAKVFEPEEKPSGIVKASIKSQRQWVRNAADERALQDGFRFNEGLAEHVDKCFAKYFRHSKGQWAGQPFQLNTFQLENIIYPLFGWVNAQGFRRFRRAYIEIPKKNYKSTTAAGIGLYMLTCDGERGAEIYSLGADKDQARIVHGEAQRMVESSPELSAALNVNRTTGVITYQDTQSKYQALSGVSRGKHGLNIHAAILDELHEWRDANLFDSIRYGIRARRQPLLFSITNSGDNLESICRREHEKAQRIIDGSVYDPSYFGLILSATIEEAQQEIENVKSGQTELPIATRCNPAVGDVLNPDDILTDIKDAISDPSAKANLLRLTYGVWNVAAQPWLNADSWGLCSDDEAGTLLNDGETWNYSPGSIDLRNMDCFAGLDLSKNRDFTAAVLMFRDVETETYYQLPMFWLPEATVDGRANLANYREWVAKGFLRSVPGTVIDYEIVTQDLFNVHELFHVEELLYDPWQAEPMRQRLEAGGVRCAKFAQTIRNFAGVTEDYERLINTGMLRHPNNEILTWQAGNCQVKTDPNKNKRPVKRQADDYRTIDGIVAGCMALFSAMSQEQVASFYDENPVEIG